MSEECLINGDDERVARDYRTIERDGDRWARVRRAFGVEPLMLCYGFASLMQSTVLQQFIYWRVGVIYNITANESLAHVCNPHKNDSGQKTQTDRLQEASAHFLLLLSLGSSIASIVTAPVYTALSDRYGRRALFLIPGSGILAKSLLESLAIHHLWPLSAFIILETLYGLSGAYNFVISLAFSYVADRSSHQSRTFRIGLVGISVAVGALAASLSSGYWITAHGYLSPFLASTVVSFFCLLYPMIIMSPSRSASANQRTEDHESESKSIFLVWTHVKSLITVHKKQVKNHSIFNGLILFIFALYNIGEMSGVDLQTTYLMSFPICMTSVQLGYYGVLNIIAINLGVALSSALFPRCLGDLFVIFICLLFGVAFNIQMSFASTTLAAYIATGSNLLSFSAFPFFRGFLSKRTKSTEQGALFGGLVLIETVCGAVSKVVMVYVYQRTLVFFHGLVFLVIGSFSFVAAILIIMAIFCSRNMDSVIKDKTDT